VAVSDWLGKPLVLEGDVEALAGRYLTAYGPATARDFATWAGLPVPDARRAIQSVAATSFEIGTTDLYAVEDLPGCQDVRMLGEFDAYLLGYQNRFQDLPKSIFPGGGMLSPAVIRAGRAIGAWRHADLSTDLFEAADLTGELADLARFCDVLP
jgi:hypothetical protein